MTGQSDGCQADVDDWRRCAAGGTCTCRLHDTPSRTWLSRLLAWLFRNPNLDRRPDWQPRPLRTLELPRCALCPRPALQDGLCGEHGGLPVSEWPAEKQARLLDDLRRGDRS